MQTKSHNPGIHFSKLVFGIFADFLHFPLWWYGFGFWHFLRALVHFLFNSWQSLAIGIWIKNIFVPMYGMRDIGSFFISFFIRLFQIIFRLVAYFILLLIVCVIAALWVVFPPLLIYLIFIQIFFHG